MRSCLNWVKSSLVGSFWYTVLQQFQNRIVMADRLKSLLSNPFLRENPYRVQQSYYGSTKSYSSSQLTISQASLTGSNRNEAILSTVACPNKTSQLMESHANGTHSIKKKSNPFFRKHLINSRSEDVFDDSSVDLFSSTCKSTVPQFLRCNQSPGLASSNYQDLSYKAPPSSQNYVSLEPNITEAVQYIQVNTISKVPAELKGHLISPRFPSVKVLEGRDLNLNQRSAIVQAIPPLCYKSSLNHIQSPRNQQSMSKRESCHQIPSLKPREPEGNASMVRSNKLIAQDESEDGQPRVITVRGAIFFRNMVSHAIR